MSYEAKHDIVWSSKGCYGSSMSAGPWLDVMSSEAKSSGMQDISRKVKMIEK